MQRKQLLEQLFQLSTYKKASIMLRDFNWDSESELYEVSNAKIMKTILKFKEENLLEELEDWANIIESRDDLGFESEKGKLLVEKLANPVLYGSVESVLKKIMELI